MPIFAITQYKLSHPHSGPIHPTLIPTKCIWCYTQRSQPGKWQLIVDLSAPEGYSINDFIDKVLPFGLSSVRIIFIRILGIEVDTVQLQLRLPPEKFHCRNKSIREWRGKSCRKRELLSLLGSLQHAVKVVKPSQAFVHRMIELSTVHKHMDACSRINQQFWGDLEWWYQMVSTWNASKYSPRHRKTLHLGQ